MTTEPSPDSRRIFFDVATRLEILDRQLADELATEADTRSISPTQLVLQKGLMTSVQVDIVDSLMRPNEIIPGYEILDVIGKGGMGVVYRARQINLDRVVALKTILVSQLAADATAVARFEQEAVTVGRLRHPNIVAAYDFGRHEGRLFLAMELVEGEDLHSYIDGQGQLDEWAAWEIARQAASGLAHAAQGKIVHRDVKPANLLLIDPPEGFPLAAGLKMVKITDFGLAFLSSDVDSRTRITSNTAAVGSPHYIAPEQLGSETVDHRADIYALGATVFHMLAGKAPYSGRNLSQIVTDKVTQPPPSIREQRDEVSTETTDLLRDMMVREPGDRVPSYSELIARIDRVVAALRPEPHDTIPLPRAKHASAGRVLLSRRRLVTGIVALSGIGLAVAGVLLLPGLLGWGAKDVALVPAGRLQPLFDGQTTDGWKTVQGGFWTVRDDAGGSKGIFCTGGDGVVKRALPPMEHYRVSVGVILQEAAVAEVHFGISLTEPDGPRWIVRLSQAGIQLGRRTGERGVFEARSPLKSVKYEPEQYYVVDIDRRQSDWLVSSEREPLGTLARGENELPEIRLSVEGGQAWFAEILLDQLVPERRE